MAFRVKSADRVLETMRRLGARYSFRHLQAADNILAMSYWKTLLPRLAAEKLHSAGRPVSIFFEVKSNLSRAQIEALASAGVAFVQPGIESLSTHILELMGKGVTALQNVFLLKCCAEYGIRPLWNLLLRIPGEKAEDYRCMEQWVPRLVHLAPPSSNTSRIELHRFSPYHFQPGVFTEDVRAAGFYSGLFPEGQVDLLKVAYYFEATWKDTLGDPAYDELQSRVGEWLRRWQRPLVPPGLVFAEAPEGRLFIEDTRGDEPLWFELDRAQSALHRAIRDITTPKRARQALIDAGMPALDEKEVRQKLMVFVEHGLALTEDDKFLGLALPAASAEELLDRARGASARRLADEPSEMAPQARMRLPVVLS
jgi:ribosomal peptide maturation radical SAM protein 1